LTQEGVALTLFWILLPIIGVTILAQAPKPAAPAAVIQQYCVTCHNDRLKTAGLVLDPSEVSRVAAKPELWEKVIRKLRSGAMPPASSTRPDKATYDSVATFLETELDKSADAKPRPGTLPLFHRLSRTEYQNAVRDLLGIRNLPRELDYSVLLPADNISSGFDNIADLLFVSPSTMERYLDAARKISRLAVGDPEIPLMVNIHRLHPEQLQDAQVEELPIGTRGGLAIRSYFPVDGEYEVSLDLAGNVRDPNEIEITVDGERMQLVPLGGAGGTGPARGRGARGRGGSSTLEFRFPVKAGERLLGVTFIERSRALGEETLRPRLRSRGSQPALASVTVSGPYEVKGPSDTPSRKRIFVCHPEANAVASTQLACARRILQTLTRRAYRRSSTPADVDLLVPFYNAGRAEGGFDMGIERALERVLVSPQFLFRIENQPANVPAGTPYRISDLELASRLSFFIWSSIPDDELLDFAIAGKLKNPASVEQQVKRMLADPRSESMVTNFAAQWLYLRDIDAKIPDELLFPDFDETLRAAFSRETQLFIDSILRENRSVLDLLTANYTFVNERLAKHYGIPNIQGSYFRRVTFPADSPRGGLLGQGSVLAVTSYATRTSPVLRGKWVLENLLSSPPPPPPPDVPALKTDGPEPGKTLTMREAMTQHRANPACAGCHARMDPIGFSMENFDALGQWRDRDSGSVIDASGLLPDGTKFEGIPGLRRLLVDHSNEFVSTVTEKLLMYAVGRNLQYYDAPAVRAIVRDAARDKYTLASLVLGVVKSTPFQMREAQK
jgi:mono/diheme cytochrome c family protein